MDSSDVDYRDRERRALDEQIAAEPPMAPLDLPDDATPMPVEAHLAQQGRRPVAVAGVVENGLVRLLDPGVRLPEHSRVIVVASETV
jgi:hypothetical protein